jgi:hypothetical protein
VFNGSTTVTALVFPPSGGQINSGGANNGIYIPPLTVAIFMQTSGSGIAAETWIADYGPNVTSGVLPANNYSASTIFSTLDVPMTSATGPGTSTVASTTTLYFAEVQIPLNTLVTGIAIFNYATVAGNAQVSLYSSAGALLANSATTVLSGCLSGSRPSEVLHWRAV